MVVKRVLTRLLRLRELEEEQSRMELELAVAERSRIELELGTAIRDYDRGRRGFTDALGDSETVGRTAGVVEMEQARRRQKHIQPRLEAAHADVSRGRERFLGRRTGRLQLETLVDQDQAAAEIDAGRRAQQMLDDWYGRGAARQASRAKTTSGEKQNPVSERATGAGSSEPSNP